MKTEGKNKVFRVIIHQFLSKKCSELTLFSKNGLKSDDFGSFCNHFARD